MSKSGARRFEVLLATLFVVWRGLLHDYWGVAFGVVACSYLFVRPTDEQHGRWRTHAVRLVTLAFLILAGSAVWKTLAR